MPVRVPSWKQPGAFVPELPFTLRRLRLRLQGNGTAVRLRGTQEFLSKDASRPFFLGLANTFLHLNIVLWVPLANQLRKDFFQEPPRPFVFALTRQRRQRCHLGFSEEKCESGGHCLAAIGGEELFYLREVGGAVQHRLNHLLAGLQAQLSQLIEYAVAHVMPLEREEGHHSVQQVLLHDARPPEAICREAQRPW
jgi:hypothetical protein